VVCTTPCTPYGSCVALSAMMPLVRRPIVGSSVQYRHNGTWVAAMVTLVISPVCVSLSIFPPGSEMLVLGQSYRGDGEGNWRWPVDDLARN
jgi:hypothetical protein